MTLIAVPWARAVVGKISVGINQTVESQPIPKAPVAMKRMTVPMRPGTMMGMSILLEFAASPPKTASKVKHADKMTEPCTRRWRRPKISIKSQARVIRKK